MPNVQYSKLIGAIFKAQWKKTNKIKYFQFI